MMTTARRRGSAPTQCQHYPPCPPATGADRLAAAVVAAHPEQGWSLLCNGVIVFDDTGAIAAGHIVPPRRAAGHPSPAHPSPARVNACACGGADISASRAA